MKISDLIPSFSAFKASTTIALEESKQALATANKTISDLSEKITALETAGKIKADETSDESSEVDQLISDLQKVLAKYSDDSDESDESEDSSDSSDDSDSTDSSDDSDDANDETAKASKTEKLKALAKQAAKIVAQNKEIKASVPAQVIREIAAVGIPTPIATKPDGKLTALKGLDRVSAAFSEQLTKK